MEIIRNKSGNYLPKNDRDVPMFKHCCGGSIEVNNWCWDQCVPVLHAHGISVEVIDEAGEPCSDCDRINGEKIYVTPLYLSGLPFWDVFIYADRMKIGCEDHPVADWKKFKPSRIKLMNHRAEAWWKEHKQMLISLAERHAKKHAEAKRRDKANA